MTQYNLAVYYLEGYVLVPNILKAVKYLRRSARQGCARAPPSSWGMYAGKGPGCVETPSRLFSITGEPPMEKTQKQWRTSQCVHVMAPRPDRISTKLSAFSERGQIWEMRMPKCFRGCFFVEERGSKEAISQQWNCSVRWLKVRSEKKLL